MVVEAAPLLDLPVHSGGPGVVTLQPVESQVVVTGDGVLGVDETQGEEGTSVLRPRFGQWQSAQIDRVLPALHNRAVADGLEADPQPLPRQASMTPELARGQGWQLLGQLNDLFEEALRAPSKGELNAPIGAEEVGHTREISPFNPFE